MSTAAAAAAATSAAASTGQAHHARLEPAADIPAERRAKLADELDGPGPSSGVAAAGRRDRRPQRSAREGEGSAVGPSAAGLGLPDDAEVQAVFDKIVGNLTKSGRKATARRIVLDAMRIMRGHLRKGDLDKVK